MAGSWGMTDEQYAAADRRYRRRWKLITIGYSLLSVAQLTHLMIEGATAFRVILLVGWVALAATSAVVVRRGMPDTRRPPAGGRQ